MMIKINNDNYKNNNNNDNLNKQVNWWIINKNITDNKLNTMTKNLSFCNCWLIDKFLLISQYKG